MLFIMTKTSLLTGQVNTIYQVTKEPENVKSDDTALLQIEF